MLVHASVIYYVLLTFQYYDVIVSVKVSTKLTSHVKCYGCCPAQE